MCKLIGEMPLTRTPRGALRMAIGFSTKLGCNSQAWGLLALQLELEDMPPEAEGYRVTASHLGEVEDLEPRTAKDG